MSEETRTVLIRNIKACAATGLPDAFIELLLGRLASFGYEVQETDAFTIGYSMQKSETYIKNECNLSIIPEGLYLTLCDMSCGEFLSTKSRTGQLNIAGLNLDGAIASISEGDTSVSFDNATTDEGKFSMLLATLFNAGRGNLACYRKFRW